MEFGLPDEATAKAGGQPEVREMQAFNGLWGAHWKAGGPEDIFSVVGIIIFCDRQNE
jgi:hypothetical protein